MRTTVWKRFSSYESSPKHTDVERGVLSSAVCSSSLRAGVWRSA